MLAFRQFRTHRELCITLCSVFPRDIIDLIAQFAGIDTINCRKLNCTLAPWILSMNDTATTIMKNTTKNAKKLKDIEEECMINQPGYRVDIRAKARLIRNTDNASKKVIAARINDDAERRKVIIARVAAGALVAICDIILTHANSLVRVSHNHRTTLLLSELCLTLETIFDCPYVHATCNNAVDAIHKADIEYSAILSDQRRKLEEWNKLSADEKKTNKRPKKQNRGKFYAEELAKQKLAPAHLIATVTSNIIIQIRETTNLRKNMGNNLYSLENYISRPLTQNEDTLINYVLTYFARRIFTPSALVSVDACLDAVDREMRRCLAFHF